MARQPQADIQCLIDPFLVFRRDLPCALPQAVFVQRADLLQQHDAVLGEAGVRCPDIDMSGQAGFVQPGCNGRRDDGGAVAVADLVLHDEHRPDAALLGPHHRRKVCVENFSSVYFHGINPPCLPLVWAVPGGGMHAGAFFHFMQRSGSGFCLFQDAERQRHPAVVAEGKAGRHVMLLHPGRRPAGEAIHRCPGGQAQHLDLAERKRLPQAGARRLEKGFLRRKICSGAGGSVGAPAGGRVGPALGQRKRLPFPGAKHPRLKRRPVRPKQAFFHPCHLTKITSYPEQHEILPFPGQTPRCFDLKFPLILVNMCK